MTAYKNNPFLLSLRQPPRSPNGKHRRTSPPAHGSSIIGTDPGARGTDKTSFTVRTGLPKSTWRTINYATANSGVGAVQIGYKAIHKIYEDILNSKPPVIPYVGVQAGEIVGHRYWCVREEGIGSIAHDFIWKPGERITGDVDSLISTSWMLYNRCYGGVYAFSKPEYLPEELADVRNSWPVTTGDYFHQYKVHGVAIGTVSLWGEVVEHERGYRAQFAKIKSLDKVIGNADLAKLREQYGV